MDLSSPKTLLLWANTKCYNNLITISNCRFLISGRLARDESGVFFVCILDENLDTMSGFLSGFCCQLQRSGPWFSQENDSLDSLRFQV